MARRKPPAVPTARIYRHFAVVTLLLTGAVALFADGENRAAMAEEIAERQQRDALARASAEKFGPPKLIKAGAPDGGGSFGPDIGEFGAPMDGGGGTGSGSGSGYIPDEDLALGFVPAAYARYGLSEAEWAALSEEEREALRREAEAEAARADTPERALQVERLKAASAARSGHGGAPD